MPARRPWPLNQEEPESLWIGRRESVTLLKRDPEAM